MPSTHTSQIRRNLPKGTGHQQCPPIGLSPPSSVDTLLSGTPPAEPGDQHRPFVCVSWSSAATSPRLPGRPRLAARGLRCKFCTPPSVSAPVLPSALTQAHSEFTNPLR